MYWHIMITLLTHDKLRFFLNYSMKTLRIWCILIEIIAIASLQSRMNTHAQLIRISADVWQNLRIFDANVAFVNCELILRMCVWFSMSINEQNASYAIKMHIIVTSVLRRHCRKAERNTWLKSWHSQTLHKTFRSSSVHLFSLVLEFSFNEYRLSRTTVTLF